MTMTERLQLMELNASLLKDVREEHDSTVQEILSHALYRPLQDLFARPGKYLRAKLVRAGFQLAQSSTGARELTPHEAEVCQSLSDVLEAIHAGSLIIDDIQDGSRERRGRPTLHEIYGTPIAINAGNFLYFQPLEWIKALKLSEKTELELYRFCHKAMLNAHLGQAIDVGTQIDILPKEKIYGLCLESLKLKTGSLTSLAIAVGAIIGGASEKRLQELQNFGIRFGIALQMFDDIGNPLLPAGHLKKFEDLKLRRPSWLWAMASELSETEADYKNFIACVQELQSDEGKLNEWLSKHSFIEKSRTQAQEYLNAALNDLKREVESDGDYSIGLSIISDVSERIRSSYG